VLRTFREQVKRVAPQATIVPSRVPSAIGAALMALEEIEVPVHDSLLSNIEAGIARLGPVKT
jgi:hypothetical protein